MDLITLDMETYYDRQYSLSKLTTEEYIRDPRFSVIGVSTKINDEPTQWVTGSAATVIAHLRSYLGITQCCWRRILCLMAPSCRGGAVSGPRR